MNRVVLASVLLCLSMAAQAAGVGTIVAEFRDASRERTVPYAIFHPEPLEGSCPVVIISHGLGGSRFTNEHLGRYLAANGFIAVHVQHAGSDSELRRSARNRTEAETRVRMSVADPRNAVNRFLDIPFVVTRLAAMNTSDERLKGHLDLAALGMAGHSYGASSTMVAAGARVGEANRSFRVPTLRAGVLLSPSPPNDRLDAARVYADVAIPLFHMTGTSDASLGEGRGITAEDRTRPYALLSIPDQYLLVLKKADHVTFSGERIGKHTERKLDAQHMAAILSGSLMFFRAYLKNDEKAKAWLRTEYRKSLAAADRFEFK